VLRIPFSAYFLVAMDLSVKVLIAGDNTNPPANLNIADIIQFSFL
jgi:hypothetical protein